MMNLRALQNEKGLTVEKMAEFLGLNPSTYGQYESGVREPNFSTLKDLSEKLNVTVDYLIGHTNLREPLPPIDDELYFEIKRIKNTRVKRAVLTLLKEMEEPDAPASLVKPY